MRSEENKIVKIINMVRKNTDLLNKVLKLIRLITVTASIKKTPKKNIDLEIRLYPLLSKTSPIAIIINENIPVVNNMTKPVLLLYLRIMLFYKFT